MNESEDLYLVSAEGGTPRRLTTLPFDKSGVGWSSDGRIIYFSGDENQDDEFSEVLTRDIWAVRVTDGSVIALTPNPGSETLPSPSLDGTRLAFVFTAERGAERDLMVVDVGGDGRFTTVPPQSHSGLGPRARPPTVVSGWNRDSFFPPRSVGIAISFGSRLPAARSFR